MERVLSGGFRSKTGLGMGLRGVKNIAHEFAVQSAPGQGTRVRAAFFLSVHR